MYSYFFMLMCGVFTAIMNEVEKMEEAKKEDSNRSPTERNRSALYCRIAHFSKNVLPVLCVAYIVLIIVRSFLY